MGNKKEKKFFQITWIVLLILIILIVVMTVISKYGLTVTGYELDSKKIQEKFKIVQLTDLHNMEFGDKNRRLINKINKLQPNLVCMVGDMLNRDDESLTVVTDLIKQLAEKYKVFFSLGNHETDYEKNFSTDLKSPLEEAGAVVLDNEYQEIEINGNKMYIGGISSYGLIEPSGDGSEYRFMKEFEQLDGFKLLMCHIPAGMLLWKGLETWNVDLVLSGHEHGGQIILPVIGPLFSQDEGFFPTYTSGQYEIAGHTLILSRGLGNSNRFVPRFNNIPEIVYTDVY